ncbi:hypothetical protein BU14_1277s0001 [Porphyra umbilicalis]|uniref:Uncharacterized protein n=1 Tax=Porphyra umbilicalis TaxID=2786 RepID=A0A1X6NM33_PORUM|nr:hypothetical protein BU14_1277s0001 [Porphyra umbilicalis]|eukprot:OSX69684.1 hypothetical protein BU14_1277s0001 [Porphyra umbilicalis]
MEEDKDPEPGGSSPPDLWHRHRRQLRVAECRLTAPFVVPAELQATLASFPHASPPNPSSARRRRVRTRQRRPATGGPAVAGADCRRGKRRRIPGVRDTAESLSDSSLAPDGNEDVYAESDSGSDVGVVDEDVLDTGVRAMQLIDYYKKRITRVLALTIGDSPQSAENAGTLFRVVSVAGGAAVVLSEGERAYVVWAQIEAGAVTYLCTCGGVGGGESVELRSWLGASSTCCHARGLRASFVELATEAGLPGDVALLETFPALDNASAPPATECNVLYATTTAKKKGIFAVNFQSTWAAVIIRNKLNKQRTKKRVQRRPACALTSCAKDHWTSPHASSVARWCSDLRDATAAATAMTAGLNDPFKDVLLPTVATSQAGTSPGGAAQSAEWAAFADEQRGRCSRNLLPCTGEVDDCHLFDRLAVTGRDHQHPASLADILCEAACFSCGSPYEGEGIKNTGAVLHTLRGRVTVTLGQWTCSCGKLVPYDGAHDGLFASSKETLFTRTFLDVLMQLVFTGHGTLSSAAAVLCFLLESTKSMTGAKSGLARQTLIVAAYRYARTLIVPASLFCCSKCKKAGDRPYLAIIADGQVLSIWRNQSQRLVRLTDDVVGVPMDAGHGSCLASAPLRAAVRKRMSADRQQVVRLTKDESVVLKRLSEELSSVPLPHPAGRVTSKSANLSWAAAFIVYSFYTNEVSATDPGPNTAGVANGQEADDGDEDADPPAAGAGAGAGGDDPVAAGGDGGETGAAAGRARGIYYVSKQVPGAVGVGLGKTVELERWRVVRRFLLTFLGHPVVGAFAGMPRMRIRRLAKKLAAGAPLAEWKPYAKAVEAVGIVWPFLQLVGTATEVDPVMSRAVGELLLFTCGVDAYWETLWRDSASAGATAFEEQWRKTSAAKYASWAATRMAPLPASSPLLCSKFSSERGLAQLGEVVSGHVWPDLPPVRPVITDSTAEMVNEARAVKVKAGREALEAMLDKELGSDDCRHAFITSQTFMPGVENFLCPCGMLIGFDFLDRAESPAHVLASLMQRFPVLPLVVYFDTACQMARNAARRVPWLVNMSQTASSIDRAHRLQKQHGCSPVHDADAYPGRSVRHRTACAESRHSINKAFKTHLVHLRQDHFLVQMRLLGAFVNLRVKMRRELGKETNHRLACAFFHAHVQFYCDRRCCSCDRGRQQAEAAAARAEDAAAAAAAGIPAPGGAPAAVAPAIAAPVGAAPGVALAGTAAAVHAAAAAVVAPAPADTASVQAARNAYFAVDSAVVGAVTPAVQGAVEDALPGAAREAAATVATRLGVAAGQAAVKAAFFAADGAGRQHGGDAVGLAAAGAAGQLAAHAPLQTEVQVAVHGAVRAAVEDAARLSSGVAAANTGKEVGVAAGCAAARAAVQAAGFAPVVVAELQAARRVQVGARLAVGQVALRAALRGALRAAGVVLKVDHLSCALVDGRVVGSSGYQDGGGDNGGNGGHGANSGDGSGIRGGVEAVGGDEGGDDVDGVGVPREASDGLSSDGLSSYSDPSDNDSDSDSE